MSVFRNEARKEQSRMRAVDTAVPEAEVEDAVVVTPERRDEPPTPAAADDAPPRPALISGDAARDLRTRWDATQIGFVDDPRQAVQQADELVAAVIESLTQILTEERKQFEAQVTETATTENLRVALQNYRSFFRRLLAL
jgi:hypothetical protein